MGDDQKIFRLRYVGSRFANARLPLDVLADLPAFRDLLVSYAKDRWRRSNPERQRLPKGFDQSISFDLVRIEGGSTIPVIAWDRHLVQPSIEGFTDEVEDIVNQSFADVVTLFFNAGIQRFPRSLSSDQIKALNRFGSGLRDGEKIEFLDHGPSNDNATYLDAARRKAIITYVRNTYELRYEGIGQLTGIHVDGEIKVLTPEHGELAIKLSPDRIKDEFDGSIDSAVQFALQIELDNQDAFQRVVEAFDVELIDQEQWEAILRCRHRLAELRSLSSGWLDGTGGMISPIALANADSFLDKRPLYATGYKISPMATGGVSLEIEVNDWDYSIDFLPNGGVDFYGIDIEGSDELELTTYSTAADAAFLESFDARTKKLRPHHD
jgi:hypothetical protein